MKNRDLGDFVEVGWVVLAGACYVREEWTKGARWFRFCEAEAGVERVEESEPDRHFEAVSLDPRNPGHKKWMARAADLAARYKATLQNRGLVAGVPG